jgi:uncharacterized Zn-finger protein
MSSKNTACSHRIIEIDTDIAVCPRPNEAIGNAHPRVYFKVKKGESVACEYCGTYYQRPHDPA